jgi:hypothetical protein
LVQSTDQNSNYGVSSCTNYLVPLNPKYSLARSAYVPPSIQETKFHIHTQAAGSITIMPYQSSIPGLWAVRGKPYCCSISSLFHNHS